jgi:hypothetical protein
VKCVLEYAEKQLVLCINDDSNIHFYDMNTRKDDLMPNLDGNDTFYSIKKVPHYD